MVWPFGSRDKDMADVKAVDEVIRRFEEARVAVTPEMADRVIAYTRSSPNADPGLVMGAAVSPTPITVEQFSAMSDANAPEESSSLMEWFGQAASKVGEFAEFGLPAIGTTKAGVRQAFAAMETLSQEAIQRPFSAATQAIDRDDLTFGQAYQQYGNSIGVNYAKSFVDPSIPKGLGDGFFPGGAEDASDGVTSPREFQKEGRTLQLGGKPITAGRAWTHYGPTNLFFDPGDRTYEFMAGLNQFAVEVVTDPTNLFTGGAGGVARAGIKGGAKLGLVDDAARIADNLLTGSATKEAIAGGVSGVARARRTISTQWANDLAQRVSTEGLTDDVSREMFGMISGGSKKTVIPGQAREVIENSDILNALVNSNEVEIWKGWSRKGANRINTKAIREMGAADNPEEVLAILTEQASLGMVTDNRFYTGVGMKGNINSKTSGLRAAAAEGSLDAENLDVAIRKMDAFAENLEMPQSFRDKLIGRMLQIDEGNQENLNNLYDKVVLEMAEDFISRGVATDGSVFQSLGNDAIGALREVIVDPGSQIAQSLKVFRKNADGSPMPTVYDRAVVANGPEGMKIRSGPLFESELDMIGKRSLPNPLDVRKAINKAGRAKKTYELAGWTFDNRVARGFSSNVFKPAVLLRPAYISRQMMDEMLRLTVGGYETLFNGPVSFLSLNALNKKASLDLLGDDILKHAAAKEFIGSDVYGLTQGRNMNRSGLFGSIDRPAVAPGETSVVAAQFTPTHVKAWRRELAQATNDRLVRRLAANGLDVDDAMDWLKTDDGRSYIKNMVERRSGAPAVFDDENLTREAVSEARQQLFQLTNGNQEVIDLVGGARVGKNGNVSFSSDLADKDASRAMSQWLKSKAPESFPASVKVELEQTKLGVEKDGIIESLYEFLLKKPMRDFIRIPAWKQEIANVAGEMMPALTPALRTEVMENLKNLGVSKDILSQVRLKASKATGPGVIDSLKEANDLVMQKSINNMGDILFDTSTRSGFQEKYDAFTPFVDAWAEALTVWGRILKDNPESVTRAVSAGRAANNNGLIYTNEYGERVFSMPRVVSDSALAGMGVGAAIGGATRGFGGAFAGAIAGGAGGLGVGAVAEPFTERDGTQAINEFKIKGFNSVTQGVGPGFGPVIQWPVNAFLDDIPQADWLRDLISPYGSGPSDVSSLADPSSVIADVTPAWMTKVLNAATTGKVDETQWNTTVGEIMQVKALSGEYDMSNPADRQRAEDDATRSARWTMLMRGLSQGVFATGPTSEWSIATNGEGEKLDIPTDWDLKADPDGRMHTVAVLSATHRQLVEEMGSYDEANAVFSRLYGLDPYWISARRSQTRTGGPTAPTLEYKRFLEGLPEGVVSELGPVLGYFAPDGEFSYQIYKELFADGENIAISLNGQIALAESAKARQQYEAFRVVVEASGADSSAQSGAMVEKAKQLNEEFPNWQTGNGTGSTEVKRLQYDDRMFLLEKAVAEPSMAGSLLTPPLKEYLDKRRLFITALQNKFGPTSTLGRREAAPLREALLQLGVQLSQSPEFAKVWPSIRSDVDG